MTAREFISTWIAGDKTRIEVYNIDSNVLLFRGRQETYRNYEENYNPCAYDGIVIDIDNNADYIRISVENPTPIFTPEQYESNRRENAKFFAGITGQTPAIEEESSDMVKVNLFIVENEDSKEGVNKCDMCVHNGKCRAQELKKSLEEVRKPDYRLLDDIEFYFWIVLAKHLNHDEYMTLSKETREKLLIEYQDFKNNLK